MCGIAGAVSAGTTAISREVMDRMVSSLNHRGPDDRGVHYISGSNVQVALGHTRLSIIDLSQAGHQPMSNEDSTVWITFNGEIYNYREIRDILKGHRFASHTDTEVIIHGYEEYGEGIFNRLNGMFALALWDCTKQRLYLARDRYGKKPLYFWHQGSTFVFASELKSLVRHPEVPREIDPKGLSRYLLYEYVPAPHCIYKGIRKLLPGHFLCFGNGVSSAKKYWSIDFTAQKVPEDDQAVQETLIRKLRESIARRLMSDVPLGVFLSGGIDSSAIVALMSGLMPAEKIKTFSIGFAEKSFDESGYARQVAKLFGTDHHEQTLTPRTMIDILPEVWSFLDEPFADASVIPTYLLSQFTRQSVTVALGGDGGDELFAGYDPFLAHRLAWIYDWMPHLIHSRLVEPLAEKLPVSTGNMSLDFRIKQFLKGIPYPVPIRNQVWLGSFSKEEQPQIFRKDFLSSLNGFDLYQDIYDSCREMRFRDQTEEIIYLYSRFYLADDILTKVDRASMATSLEVRAPFLDVEFAEFVNSLPSRYKLHGYARKYLLKKGLEKILPRDILYRKKKGFGIPLSEWLKNDLRNLVLEVFSPERIRRAGIFNPPAIEAMVDQHLKGKKDNRKQIWTLLMFEMWQENHLEKRILS
jgi:asparagine synthase (glutamine-hydrolysing)